MVITIDDFFELRKQFPVVDVRSEGEYQEGHIRNAVNIPLLNNAERAEVGTIYKQRGQMEAIKAGFRLVGPRLLDIINETEKAGKEILVHCWRGGMRSNNFCQFAAMAGIKTYSLKGGYKSYRQAAQESFQKPMNILLLTGCTGSGKSEVLRALKQLGEQVLDLEHLASHKGSAFGAIGLPPQPTTEQFQNELFEEIMGFDLSRRIWVEDESIAIGKIFLPAGFWKTMHNSPMVQMDVPKEVRVQRLVNEYGATDRELFLSIMQKITKRLGGQHFNAAKERLMAGDMTSTIEILLTYYDKAYLQSIEKRKDKVISVIPWNGGNLNAFAEEVLTEIK
jgi:tRNA 2-selenouridine synthase